MQKHTDAVVFFIVLGMSLIAALPAMAQKKGTSEPSKSSIVQVVAHGAASMPEGAGPFPGGSALVRPPDASGVIVKIKPAKGKAVEFTLQDVKANNVSQVKTLFAVRGKGKGQGSGGTALFQAGTTTTDKGVRHPWVEQVFGDKVAARIPEMTVYIREGLSSFMVGGEEPQRSPELTHLVLRKLTLPFERSRN